MLEPAHRMTVRVYYEDTDFSGRVYHASYLRFFERGRTEWLRAAGFEHNSLAQTQGVAFAVSDLQVRFLAPAVIDDELEVTTEAPSPSGVRLCFRQTIARSGKLLATGDVTVVTIKGARPVRPPRDLLDALLAVRRR